MIFQAEFEKLVQSTRNGGIIFHRRTNPSGLPRKMKTASVHVRFHRGAHFAAGNAARTVSESNLPETMAHREVLIDIDDYGYLKRPEELSAAANVPADKISAVLSVIQSFDLRGRRARTWPSASCSSWSAASRKHARIPPSARLHGTLGKRRIPEIARAPLRHG